MHKEINPAVFAIVTFPFLFGVMFGDVGHGFLLFFMGLVLILINRKYKDNPDMEGFLSMRYILLMMGFFAMFCGLIYNEFFAIPMTIFGRSYYKLEVQVLDTSGRTGYKREWDQSQDSFPNTVYPFGMDPIWPLSDQLLTFHNNFKMKLAVIFGIVQMLLGVVMKGLNSLYFRNKLDFFFEFIPQFLLMFALFGWMDILIIAKWAEKKDIENIFLDPCPSSGTEQQNIEAMKLFQLVNKSPAIISTMIDNFLNFGDNGNKTVSPCPLIQRNEEFHIEYNHVVGA